MLKDKINKIKKDKKITNDMLSELSGVPKSTLAKITSGRTPNPKLETLRAITKGLGCNLDDLYEEGCTTAEVLSSSETYLINNFRNLNKAGQEYILQTMDLVKDRYKKSDSTSILEEVN